jgi:hypothetical protein
VVFKAFAGFSARRMLGLTVREGSQMGTQSAHPKIIISFVFGFESPLGQKRRTGPRHARLRVSAAHHVLGDHSQVCAFGSQFPEAALSSHLQHDLPWSVACSTLLERGVEQQD